MSAVVFYWCDARVGSFVFLCFLFPCLSSPLTFGVVSGRSHTKVPNARTQNENSRKKDPKGQSSSEMHPTKYLKVNMPRESSKAKYAERKPHKCLKQHVQNSFKNTRHQFWQAEVRDPRVIDGIRRRINCVNQLVKTFESVHEWYRGDSHTRYAKRKWLR